MLGPLGKGDLLGHERLAESLHIQKPERSRCLDVGCPGHLLLLDQVQLKPLDLLGSELRGAAPEVTSELGDVAEVAVSGGFGAVASLQLLLHSLTKLGHGNLLPRS